MRLRHPRRQPRATTSLSHSLHRRGWARRCNEERTGGPLPVGRTRMKNAGATEPRRLPNELENVRRSRYFFLAAFFLAAGFLAAFFLAAMLVYLLHSISDPMNLVAGPKCIPRKGLPAHQLVASVIATMSSTTFKLL